MRTKKCSRKGATTPSMRGVCGGSIGKNGKKQNKATAMKNKRKREEENEAILQKKPKEKMRWMLKRSKNTSKQKEEKNAMDKQRSMLLL